MSETVILVTERPEGLGVIIEKENGERTIMAIAVTILTAIELGICTQKEIFEMCEVLKATRHGPPTLINAPVVIQGGQG